MARHIPPGAIGIFDSGVGGLTVAKEIRKVLPREHLLYFGDTQHVPYGSKSASTIIDLSRANTRYLLSRKVKCVVVACNTSTAVALATLQKEFPVPIMGVIEPGAEAAVTASPGGRIAVIGTRRTISSGAYSKAISRLNPRATVTERACPLLVPIIEEGLRSAQAIDAVLKEYIGDLARSCDTLVLGCTHYPLLSPRLRRLWPRLVRVDSARTTALAVKALLEQRQLASTKGVGRTLITTNDINEIFIRIAGKLFPQEPLEAVSWDLEGNTETP